MGWCCWTITRAVRLSDLNFSEATAQNSGVQTLRKVDFSNRDRLAAHAPHRECHRTFNSSLARRHWNVIYRKKIEDRSSF
jgi:hypothetical protein